MDDKFLGLILLVSFVVIIAVATAVIKRFRKQDGLSEYYQERFNSASGLNEKRKELDDDARRSENHAGCD